MTPNYKRKMMEVVTAELNKVYQKFIFHNPDFIRRGGKVSILGHSLGSLLALDILNHQPFSPNHYQPIPSSPVFEKFISFDHGSHNPVSLDFPVTNFFALGSPIGLFLLLKGCKLGARLSDSTATGESTAVPCFRPAVENLYNVFHRSDPVAHRVEVTPSRLLLVHFQFRTLHIIMSILTTPYLLNLASYFSVIWIDESACIGSISQGRFEGSSHWFPGLWKRLGQPGQHDD